MSPRTNFKRFSKKHSFKVFRKTTRYKKYRLGMTKVVRRWYMRKKRKTSLYMNAHPIYTWIRHYLKHRQFVRFTQSIGLNAITGYSSVSDFAIKNSLVVGSPFGFHTYSCSYKILNKNVYFTNDIFTDVILSSHSRNSFIQFNDLEASLVSNDLGTNNLYVDKLCYPFNLEQDLEDQYKSLINNIDDLVFEVTLLNIIEFRRTMTLLTLLNISKIQNSKKNNFWI